VVPGRPCTNQVSELYAAILALEVVLRKQPRPASLRVLSDSTYVVKGMNEWRHTWKRTGRWLLDASEHSKGIANRGWWHWLDRLEAEAEAGGMRVVFEWVKGHAENEGNNAADRLATAAAAAAAIDSKDI
jgi:ribonuclease HI